MSKFLEFSSILNFQQHLNGINFRPLKEPLIQYLNLGTFMNRIYLHGLVIRESHSYHIYSTSKKNLQNLKQLDDLSFKCDEIHTYVILHILNKQQLHNQASNKSSSRLSFDIRHMDQLWFCS